MDWINLTKTIAPWIGTALGGPLGGIAVEAITKTLGINSNTSDALKQAISGMTSEQMLALKQADNEFAIKMQSIGFEHEEKIEEFNQKSLQNEIDDRKDSRNREIQLKDDTNKILAYIIIGSFITIIGATLLGYAKVESALTGTLVGYISAKAEQIIAYYFGSSKGGEKKSELLAKSIPNN